MYFYILIVIIKYIYNLQKTSKGRDIYEIYEIYGERINLYFRIT